MIDRIFTAKPTNLLENDILDHQSHQSNNLSQNSERSCLTHSVKANKTNLLYSKILFPYENERRKADKYIENYSAVKPEINENLRKFLKNSQQSSLKRNNSANISKDQRHSDDRSASRKLLEHPNSLHFSILNQFLNSNERKINHFYGKDNLNISSISRIVERNVTKNYLPIDVNKFRKTMVPAGYADAFSRGKTQGSMRKLDDYWKIQKHDEAKLDKIFNNIYKKKREIEGIEKRVKGRVEEVRAVPARLIDGQDVFWEKFDNANRYYEEFTGLKEKFEQRHRKLLGEYFREKLQFKVFQRGSSSLEILKNRMKNNHFEKFETTLKKIETERNNQYKKNATFRPSEKNRSSFSLHDKL